MTSPFAFVFDGTLLAAVPAGLVGPASTWLGLVLLGAAGLLAVAVDLLGPARPARGRAATAVPVRRGRAVVVSVHVLALLLAVLGVLATLVRFAVFA